MLSRHFLSWAERAPAGERAEAAGDLARAFLYAEIDPVERGEIERAMTKLLDDPSPLVRRALAEALGCSVDAPHHLLTALADDQPDIAALVLARSPRFTDGELIDRLALGEAPAQCAIAARPGLSVAVAGALAEVGTVVAVLALCRNEAATLADLSVCRILARFGRDGEVRAALGARSDLGVALRHELVVATADALRAFVTDRGWIAPERARRIASDGADRAALHLARLGEEGDGDLGRLRFVGSLRRAGRLTPALLVRAVLSGQAHLFEAALAELTGQRLARVSGIVRRPDALAFAALIRSAGLPDSLVPTLRAALDAGRAAEPDTPAKLSRNAVTRALSRCAPGQDTSLRGLTALLRRFESEAAREGSRVPMPPSRPASARERRIEPRFDESAAADLVQAA